jgi:hypothetical protein
MFVGRHTVNLASPCRHAKFLGRSRPFPAGRRNSWANPGLGHRHQSRLGCTGAKPGWASTGHVLARPVSLIPGWARAFLSGWAAALLSLAGPFWPLRGFSVRLPRHRPGPTARACPDFPWRSARPRLGRSPGAAASSPGRSSLPAGPRHSRPVRPHPEFPWATPG